MRNEALDRDCNSTEVACESFTGEGSTWQIQGRFLGVQHQYILPWQIQGRFLGSTPTSMVHVIHCTPKRIAIHSASVNFGDTVMLSDDLSTSFSTPTAPDLFRIRLMR